MARYTKTIGITVFILGAFFLGPTGEARAASLFLAPASGTFQVGETFFVNVFVESADQAANAVSGLIAYPKEKLKVISLSKSKSLVTYWVQEPVKSKDTAEISFEGVLFNPGYTGAQGKILTLKFQALTVGQAELSFSSGSVLANDGLGTNILSKFGSASYRITTARESSTPPKVPIPKVSSKTNLDPSKWYREANVIFIWKTPVEIEGVSLAFDDKVDTEPPLVSAGLMRKKEYREVADGIHYFHLRFLGADGWGPIAHFKVQIDTHPPTSLEIKFAQGKVTDEPRPKITLTSADEPSGIDHYELKIGEQPTLRLEPDMSEAVKLPFQTPGKKVVIANVFDRAGNSTSATEEIEIVPLKPPVITSYPKDLKVGDHLELQGQTYPSATVALVLEGEQGEKIIREQESFPSGDFRFRLAVKLLDGVYNVFTSVRDARGATSLPSSPVTIVVKPPLGRRIGSAAMSYLSIFVSIIALFILLLLLVFYIWRRLRGIKQSLRHEMHEVDKTIHQAFKQLHEDVRREVKTLERMSQERALTQQEERMLSRLQRSITKAEKSAKKSFAKLPRVL